MSELRYERLGTTKGVASTFLKPLAGMAVLVAGLGLLMGDGDVLGVLGLFAVMVVVLLLLCYASLFRVRRTGAIVFDSEGLKARSTRSRGAT